MTQSIKPTKKRALLLGCPDERLKGVYQDLQTMKAILAPRGFDCATAYEATRDQIVDSLQSLARSTAPGDAVVVYYSGHGGLVRRSGSSDAARPLQFLVPCDFDETTDADFRGVTDAQLSQLLRGVTDRTENVTLVLDCCHAARMARLPGTVKTVDGEFYAEVFSHVRKMLSDGRLDGGAHHERNPRLLTVAASAQGESAYERPFEGEARQGVLTEALERILGRVPQGAGEMPDVSWRSVMVRVRDRFKVTCPSQFPQVEGDDLRLTFSLSRAELEGALPVEVVGSRVVLHGGELHGVREGDTYAVLPAAEERNNAAREIAKATVQRVGSIASQVSLSRDVAQLRAAGGLKAFPKSRKMGRLPVAVGHWRCAVDVAGLVGASPFLYVTDEREAFALVRQERATVYLESREAGEAVLMGRWELAKDNQAKSVAECVRKMESMARSRQLFAVAKETESKRRIQARERTGSEDIARHVSVEVGTVVDGVKTPSGPRGLVVKEGDKIYIEVRNGGQKAVYASIFDLCPDTVSLLSTASPSGRELQPGETYLYGERDIVFGDLEGSEMSWPEGMPRDSRRFFERIVVVVTSGRMDLRCLETQSGSTARGDEIDEEELSDLLSDIIFDNTRGGVGAQRNEPVQFGMRWASIELRQA